MITRLEKLRKLGIFRDFSWSSDLQDFCRFNLIYGWNGSGKTTFSRLFECLGENTNARYPELVYQVQGDQRSWRTGEPFDEKVRVFNRDYVLANVERLDGPVPIYILGDENKQLADQIVRDEAEISRRNDELSAGETVLAGLTKSRDTIFTDIARRISENVSGESTRTYRRPNAETDFGKLTQNALLDEGQVLLHKGTIAQKQLPILESLPSLDSYPAKITNVVENSTPLLETMVTSVVIERLTKNPDISNWVEEGMALNRLHTSSICEFCDREMPAERLRSLADHFNDADRELKAEVDTQLAAVHGIVSILERLSTREPSNLYDELRAEYKAAVTQLNTDRMELTRQLAALIAAIDGKKAKTTESVVLDVTVDPQPLIDSLAVVNACISEHNRKTKDFDAAKSAARKALKDHYLSEIADEVADLDARITEQATVNGKIKNGDEALEGSMGIGAMQRQVADNRATVSSAHRGCGELNDKLCMFLGRDEIMFEVRGEGYVVKRYGEIAEDLSEGEKTAIAFVYFIVHLQDRDFDLKNGIVVIDDPVSSLDANSLFQAFAFLKDSVKDAKQVFILTHNLEFMRQVKNWFFHIKKVAKKPQRSLYMIKNRIVDGHRDAYLAPMDRLLMEFESEYHYLFSLLRGFQDDGTLSAIYLFPNIGRKFLETFLAFKIPSGDNLHDKMSRLEYPDVEKAAILRFVETHSHAERSDGVMHFDQSLSSGGQQVISSLLSMIKHVDPDHYMTLSETCDLERSET